jgi:uncharacterized coiled-coil protein SlyX
MSENRRLEQLEKRVLELEQTIVEQAIFLTFLTEQVSLISESKPTPNLRNVIESYKKYKGTLQP